MQFDFSPRNETAALVMPYMVGYVAPGAVKMLALGALVSGLLASADSAIFGLASILSHNFYRHMWRPKASNGFALESSVFL